MFNPHPPLTGFPLVVLVLAAGAECIAATGLPWLSASKMSITAECRRFSAILVKLLCVLAPITYYSGYWGSSFANQSFKIAEETIAAHQALGKSLIISLIPLLLFLLLSEQTPERALLRVCYRVFLSISLLLVILTSRQGGNLVFEHGAGVYAVP